jgi:hypothetical protein
MQGGGGSDTGGIAPDDNAPSSTRGRGPRRGRMQGGGGSDTGGIAPDDNAADGPSAARA